VFCGVEPLEGFHPAERDELGPFVWTQGSFRIAVARRAPFARLALAYMGHDGILTVRSPGGAIQEAPLCRGWQNCVVRLADATAGGAIECRVAPIVDAAGDARELGVMLREIEAFDDQGRFERLDKMQRNLRLNQRECRAGRTALESLPAALRVNLEVRCNIPETSQACAYCAWDWAKAAERGSPTFTPDTLDELGEFYESAIEVNDCSIGEPTMSKHLGPIAARIDRDGKAFSLTTNGQLLSPRLRREIVGKNVELYVSIDAATAAGYARYRNHRFDDVIANLTALCKEKKAHGGLPRVYASFIVMRSNVDELPAFFALMSEVGVDQIKLRALYLDDNVDPLVINNGYSFDYAAEVLAIDELAAAMAAARWLAEKHRLALYVEPQQFAVDVAQAGGPVCNEPWRTLYVLGRGIMPCCYATQPIAAWHERGDRPLDAFLRDVFNGPLYREIRGELAAGRLSDYCRNTPSCPILKSMQREGLVAAPQNAYQRRALAESSRGQRPLPLVPLETLTAAGPAA
jgi:MoaA/NifB/PqqE/SkfB family radical SAM enzyme